MANHVYNNMLSKLPLATAPWTTGTWKVTLLTLASYVFSATDTLLASVAADVLVGCVDQTLAAAAVSSIGVCSANSSVFTGVSGSQNLKAVVVYIVDAGPLNHLMIYYDTGLGLPLTTSGGNITVDWNATVTAGTLFTVTGP